MQYFTANHLVVTPPASGYLLIFVRARINVPGDNTTLTAYGLYISTSSTPPTGGTVPTFFNFYGYQHVLEVSASFGDYNPNIITAYPRSVTAGNTYHIWFGCDGVFVGSKLSVYNPTITAVFVRGGM